MIKAEKEMLRPVPRREYGTEGENLARAYLEKKGYRHLASKFNTRWGEIDLIMEEGACLVFVEVKRRRSWHYGLPEESITRTKRQHMLQAALSYLQTQGSPERMMRFDVLSLDSEGIRHFPNAFDAGNDYYF